MVSRISGRRVLTVVAAAVVSLTCGEGAGPDPNVVSRVVITPALDTLRSLGERIELFCGHEVRHGCAVRRDVLP